jgi:2,3,4,5-tetrahydropyridine-2,6-dicarboxylate N-succinyltransferase
MTVDQVKQGIDSFSASRGEIKREDVLPVFTSFLRLLNNGTIRAAIRVDGSWRVNQWVKQGILLGFRFGEMREIPLGGGFVYFDKDTYPLKTMSIADGVRIVPGGTSVRSGSYVAPGVVIMPPAYINVGAYVDTGSMIDSHALVGSCAQIGKNVHLSAAAQIGGVLEPIGSMPVIIEDKVMVGGNAGIYEGTIVRTGAVIGAGVVITGSTPVYDVVHGTILRKTTEAPLEIPENAVVIPGTRNIKGGFAEENRLGMVTPVIVKYRDAKTTASTALEEALR